MTIGLGECVGELTVVGDNVVGTAGEAIGDAIRVADGELDGVLPDAGVSTGLVDAGEILLAARVTGGLTGAAVAGEVACGELSATGEGLVAVGAPGTTAGLEEGGAMVGEVVAGDAVCGDVPDAGETGEAAGEAVGVDIGKAVAGDCGEGVAWLVG